MKMPTFRLRKNTGNGSISVLQKLDFIGRCDERRLVALALGISIALAAAAGTVVWASAGVQHAYDSLGRETARVKEAERQLAHARLQVVRAQKARTLMNDAEANSLTVGAWSFRRLAMTQTIMTRSSLNEILSESVRSKDRLFGASEFDIATRDTDAGLFGTPRPSDKDVVVSLNALMYFRTAGEK
ncbi:hypothetical protein [Burkholderia seminalis]|uniref:hypothetical protein n=1 Tax=Burkholderia seminalis TaxID=488731 RepID=UPI001583A201|nr:hypothetical protein [Burkholderia seminalis]MCA8306775.1 hypothetical protein [Burkholderia seminalis]MCA8435255.1 hypothetical protein [Burkholderia seminalis]